MPALPAFRHYCICQDAQGGTIELWRGAEEVACLAFDTRRQVLVELHVAIGAPERQRDLRSFQNLLQLAAPLRHRHLLGIIEGGEDDGANYHITDFLDGERLDAWLKRLVPLPPWLALTVLLQLVEGLAALASHPRLLAGVEVFHAGIMLTGERVEDVLVKICDLGLAGAKPMSTEPQFVEARAIHEAGRLLLYMLTGSLLEGAVTADTLSGSHAAPELGFLLATIFQAAAPHHPRTLEQLRSLVERCRQDLSGETSPRPEKLPAVLRPRLPLADLLPPGEAVAEAAGEDCSVDTRPGDAAHPYRHRGTERATRHPATVQLLPPPEIVPAEFFAPLVDQSWAARSSGGAPHLLKLRNWNAAAQPPVIVEELPGKWTLEAMVRTRQRLEPAEALLILQQLEAAVESAAALELPMLWRSPQLLPVQFIAAGAEEAMESADKLSRLPLSEWPAFRLKMRTWPLMLNFTQPERFQLDRLMPRDPGLPLEAPSFRAGIMTPPTSRDFALLAVWMMGGTAQLRENVKALLYETLRAKPSAADSRKDFLERLHQRVEAASASASATPARPAGEDAGNASGERFPLRPNTPPRPQPPLAPGSSGTDRTRGKPAKRSRSTAAVATLDAGPAPVSSEKTSAAPEGGLFSQARIVEEEDPDAPVMGFAEALFGGNTSSGSPADAHPLFGSGSSHPVPEDPEIPEGAPLGFMEAAGLHGNFSNGPEGLPGVHLPPRRSPLMMLLVVVLISAAIAALMAELSGRAVWHR